MIPNSDNVQVLSSAPDHAERMEDLMHQSYGTTRDDPDEVFTAAMFRHHLQVFPAGQFVALCNDRVVGLTVSARTPFDFDYPPMQPWWQSAGEGWLTHDPRAAWMLGVESVVHPDYRSAGVGGRLMAARFAIARSLNLRGMIAGSAIVSYGQVSESVSVEDYVRGVIAGTYFDMNLSKQIKKGFVPGVLIPDYLPGDTGSRAWGVTIVWHNRDHDPTRPIL